MSGSYVDSSRGLSVAGVIGAVVSPVVKLARFVNREFEIARARHHLESLNDDVLKDIGLHRSEIYAATRQSRR